MRKLMVLSLMIIMVLSSASFGYGQVINDSIAPCFVSVLYYSNSFDIDENGNATFSLMVYPLNRDLPDQVKATVKIINKSTGAVSYNQTLNLPYVYLYDQFRISDSHTLTQSGIYEFQVTYKCYGDGVLLETITANPQLDSF
ncbi:MAG: hypothetical protein IJN72_05605 [Firmicutes bacterium]|nr:hypothetical protein [Bacillota bacterium]